MLRPICTYTKHINYLYRLIICYTFGLPALAACTKGRNQQSHHPAGHKSAPPDRSAWLILKPQWHLLLDHVQESRIQIGPSCHHLCDVQVHLWRATGPKSGSSHWLDLTSSMPGLYPSFSNTHGDQNQASLVCDARALENSQNPCRTETWSYSSRCTCRSGADSASAQLPGVFLSKWFVSCKIRYERSLVHILLQHSNHCMASTLLLPSHWAQSSLLLSQTPQLPQGMHAQSSFVSCARWFILEKHQEIIQIFKSLFLPCKRRWQKTSKKHLTEPSQYFSKRDGACGQGLDHVHSRFLVFPARNTQDTPNGKRGYMWLILRAPARASGEAWERRSPHWAPPPNLH